MTCVLDTPSTSTVDDQFRSMLRDKIQEGLSSLRWGWLQSVAPDLRNELAIGSDSSVTPSLIKSIIAEAELAKLWPLGWAETQLAEARAQQRYRKPRSRYAFVARGEQAGNHTLTTRGVRVIRRRYKNRYKRKVTIKMLAKEFRVCTATIRRVLHNETWRHVR